MSDIVTVERLFVCPYCKRPLELTQEAEKRKGQVAVQLRCPRHGSDLKKYVLAFLERDRNEPRGRAR